MEGGGKNTAEAWAGSNDRGGEVKWKTQREVVVNSNMRFDLTLI